MPCTRCAVCRRDDSRCSARPVPKRVVRSAPAAFVAGSVAAGQVVHATRFGGIIWMSYTILALGAVAALRSPRNAKLLDFPFKLCAEARNSAPCPATGVGAPPPVAAFGTVEEEPSAVVAFALSNFPTVVPCNQQLK
jgi:hypothetical protein